MDEPKNIHGYFLNIDSFGIGRTTEIRYVGKNISYPMIFRNSQFVNKIITPVQYEKILKILKEK